MKHLWLIRPKLSPHIDCLLIPVFLNCPSILLCLSCYTKSFFKPLHTSRWIISCWYLFKTKYSFLRWLLYGCLPFSPLGSRGRLHLCLWVPEYSSIRSRLVHLPSSAHDLSSRKCSDLFILMPLLSVSWPGVRKRGNPNNLALNSQIRRSLS